MFAYASTLPRGTVSSAVSTNVCRFELARDRCNHRPNESNRRARRLLDTALARVGEEVGEGVAVGDAGPIVLGVGLESRVEGEGRGKRFEDGFVLEFYGQLEVDDGLPVDRVGEVRCAALSGGRR